MQQELLVGGAPKKLKFPAFCPRELGESRLWGSETKEPIHAQKPGVLDRFCAGNDVAFKQLVNETPNLLSVSAANQGEKHAMKFCPVFA